jgi:hypothetical protein
LTKSSSSCGKKRSCGKKKELARRKEELARRKEELCLNRILGGDSGPLTREQKREALKESKLELELGIKFSTTKKNALGQLSTTFLLAWYLTILNKSLQPLACSRPEGLSGAAFLNADPTIRCWDNSTKHIVFTCIWSMATFVHLSYALRTLIASRKRLQEEQIICCEHMGHVLQVVCGACVTVIPLVLLLLGSGSHMIIAIAGMITCVTFGVVLPYTMREPIIHAASSKFVRSWELFEYALMAQKLLTAVSLAVPQELWILPWAMCVAGIGTVLALQLLATYTHGNDDFAAVTQTPKRKRHLSDAICDAFLSHSSDDEDAYVCDSADEGSNE